MMKRMLRQLLAIVLVLIMISGEFSVFAESVGTIELPASVQAIGDEAFCGDASISEVIVPEGTTRIGSRAFAESGLTAITLPSSLQYIAEDAFEGCGKLKVNVSAGCYAYDWCDEHGLLSYENAASAYGTIRFGRYEQDGNTANGPEPIEWLVLDSKDGSLFLLSLKTLDCRQYHTSQSSVTWATSSLRSWLNGTFLSTAFTEDERARILRSTVGTPNNPKYGTSGGPATQDYVFLPSLGEMEQYFVATGIGLDYERTAYCLSRWNSTVHSWNGAYLTNEHLIWLRSPGFMSSAAASIPHNNSWNSTLSLGYYGDYVNKRHGEVRPAIRITTESISDSTELQWEVGSNSSEKLLSLSMGTSWKAASIPDWITLSAESGSKNAAITVSIKENTGLDRIGVVRFESSARSVCLVVAQEGSLRVGLSGRVCLEDGSGLSGVQVTLYDDETVIAGETVTDADGFWTVSGIRPFETYTVYYKHDSYTAEPTRYAVSNESASLADVVAAESTGSTLAFLTPLSGSKAAANTALYMNWTAVEGASYYRYSARYVEDDEAFIIRRMTNSTEAWIPVTQIEPGRELQLWAAAFGESDDDLLSQQIIRVTVEGTNPDGSAGHEHVYGDAYNEGDQWYRACACGDVVTVIRSEYQAEIEANGNVTLCDHGVFPSFCCACAGSHDWDLHGLSEDDDWEDLPVNSDYICVRCGQKLIHSGSPEALYYDALNNIPEGTDPIDDPIVHLCLSSRMQECLSERYIEKILDALQDAPEAYRDLYLYSFCDYDLEKTKGKCTYTPSNRTIYINEAAYSNVNNFLSVWFHEAGHAIDHNAGARDVEYMSMSMEDGRCPLYVSLCADVRNTAAEILKEEVEPTMELRFTADELRWLIEAASDPFAPKESNSIHLNAALEELRKELCRYVYNHLTMDLPYSNYYVPNSHLALDIYGGVTNNYIYDSFNDAVGHGVKFGDTDWNILVDKPYYWFTKDQSPTYAQCKEAFAEFYSGVMFGNDYVNNLNREAFPYAYDRMSRIMVPSLLMTYKALHP